MAGERALPGLGLFGFWTLGSNGWGTQHSEGIRTLSVLTQPRCKSFLAAVPGSPVDGDIHVLTSAPNLNAIAVRDAGAWVYLTPGEGFLIYDEGANRYMRFSGTEWLPLLPMPTGTGDTGKALLVSADGKSFEIGVPPAPTTIPVNNESGSYSLVLGDAGGYVRIASATAVNLTVPTNAAVPFPVGTVIQLRQAGGGQITVVPGSGVAVNTAETLKLRKEGSSASLIKVAADEWDLTGDLELI